MDSTWTLYKKADTLTDTLHKPVIERKWERNDQRWFVFQLAVEDASGGDTESPFEKDHLRPLLPEKQPPCGPPTAVNEPKHCILTSARHSRSHCEPKRTHIVCRPIYPSPSPSGQEELLFLT